MVKIPVYAEFAWQGIICVKNSKNSVDKYICGDDILRFVVRGSTETTQQLEKKLEKDFRKVVDKV